MYCITNSGYALIISHISLYVNIYVSMQLKIRVINTLYKEVFGDLTGIIMVHCNASDRARFYSKAAPCR